MLSHERRGEQHLAIKVMQGGHMHVDRGGLVGPCELKHVAPIGVLRLELQSRLIVRGSTGPAPAASTQRKRIRKPS